MTKNYLGMILAEPDDLEHFGVKGMRWGVRKDLQFLNPATRADYLHLREEPRLAQKNANPKFEKVLRKSKAETRRFARKLKRDYKSRNLDIKNDPLAKARYEQELGDATVRSVETAMSRVHGNSVTGIYKYTLVHNDAGGLRIQLEAKDTAKLRKQLASVSRSDKRRPEGTTTTVYSGKKDMKTGDTDGPFVATATRSRGNVHLVKGYMKHDDFEDVMAFESMSFEFLPDEDGFYDISDDELTHDHLGDYTAAQVVDEEDLEHYGVPGMKWGVRRDRTKGSDHVGERIAAKPHGNIQDHVESSSARYDRLAKQAREGKASEMTDQDLKFFNARTEALAKIKKMNEVQPSWLASTGKKVLQTTAQKTMQSISDGLADKYISRPVLDAFGSPKKPKKKQPLALPAPKK